MELNSIHRNLGLFLATAPSPTLGLANRVYISLPDTSPTCATWTGLAPLPTGWSYVCSTPANFRRTDGTGWIPVNFDASAGGSPFAVLPIDPVNNVSHYYTYVTGGSWNLTALMESSHESTLRPAVKDGGAMPGVLEIGTNPRLGPFTRDRGLVGFWRFEEGTGTTTADSSGNANTGTLTGPTWQPPANCKQGRCLSFDGVDDFANMSLSNFPASMTDVTLAFWARPSGALTTNSLFIATPDDAGNRINLHFPWSNGAIFWDFGHAEAGGRLSTTWSSTWNNAWAHFVFTSQSGVGQRIFRNGVLLSSDADASSFSRGARTLDIARLGTTFWGGLLDDVRIYNRTLSASEIAAIYAATK
jgi:hypothetical protein